MRKGNYGTMGAGYLKARDFAHFLDDSPEIREIELSNSGEIFLNPELPTIFRLGAEHGVRLDIGNGTNFNQVDDEAMEELVRCQAVHYMTFSIDGASQETYGQYRRNGNFDQVMRNLDKLIALKESYHSYLPHLTWQYVLFQHNESDVEKAIAMAKERGMEIRFKLDWDTNAKFQPKDPEKLTELTGLHLFSASTYREEQNEKYMQSNICQGMLFQPQINYDGRLLGCCGVYQYDWSINVFETGLYPAVNSRAYKDAICMLLGGALADDPSTPCGGCWMMPEFRAGMKMRLLTALD